MNSKTITFIVTKDCQLACKYCYLVGKNNKERLSIEVAKKAIDYLIGCEWLKSYSDICFDFIGGEPLLEIELIGEICEYIDSQLKKMNHPWAGNCTYSMTTNGLLYNSESVQRFIHKYRNRLEISISIDGNKKKTDLNRIFTNGRGSYDHIIDNVRLWLNQFPDSMTKMVVSHEDLPYVFESAKHLIDLGIKRIDINPVLEYAWSEGDDTIYFDQLMKLADYLIDTKLYKRIRIYVFEESIGYRITDFEKFDPCRNSLFTIDGNGSFYKCLRFAQFSLRTKSARKIGNLETGIDSNLLRPFNILNSLSLISEECRECEVATGCRWCPAENYDSSETGSVFIKSKAICRMHKARVKANNYYHRRIQVLEESQI